MNYTKRDYVRELQDYALSMLRDGNETKPLWMLAKYNCSEVSWLVGLRVLEALGPISRPFTLKGDVGNSEIEKVENLHDILGYFDPDFRKYVVVDPTIWQFYPRKRSIYIGSFATLEDAIKAVSRVYSGKWALSYYVDEIDDDIAKSKEIIRLNCDQAPKWEEHKENEN